MDCYRCATPLPDTARFCLTCGADVSGGSSGERTQPVEVDAELMAKLQEDIGTEYSIERELGRGGMAVVYLAIDVHLGRRVAVKVLPPELTFAGGPHVVERFKREARTAATLDHHHIIPIHRVSTSGKLSWYVMKYLEGRTLADILETEGPLTPERTADIVAQVAQGLEYAHRRSVIHRDVKPANIAVDAEGWVTVADFGIAKALDTSSLTGSGSMIGTPYYMSPEQCAGQKVTGAADQYSLAVVAYQMLSGHLPFTGQAVVDIIKKHCMDPPPPLGVLRPGLHPAVVAAVHRGLEKSAAARFPSVRDFAAALTEAAHLPPVESTVPVARPVRPRRASETAVVRRAPDSVRPTQPPPVAEPPVSPAAPAQRTEPARTADPPRLHRERRSRLPIALGAVGTLALAGIFFGPLVRDTLNRQVATSAVDTLQPSGQAATPVQPPRPAADSALPTDSGVGGPTADTSAVAPAPARPTSTSVGTLVLRGVPRGATVYLDGRQVRGSRIVLQPDLRHGVVVEAEGLASWSDEVLVSAGQTVSRTVRMQTIADASGQPAPAAAAPATAQPGPQPAQQLAATAAGVAYITVGSRPTVPGQPLASIFINGRPVSINPVSNFEVPAGLVRLRFTVTDETGQWSYDTTVTVAAGERRNLGRIALVRRP